MERKLQQEQVEFEQRMKAKMERNMQAEIDQKIQAQLATLMTTIQWVFIFILQNSRLE